MKFKKHYKSIENPISQKDEKTITVTQIYVHPIRGLKAEPVKFAFMCPYGLMNDRVMVLIDVEKNAPCTSNTDVELSNLS